MSRRVLASVFALVLAIAPVHGGSQAWETSISHASLRALNAPTMLIGENATTEGGQPPAVKLHKRYLSLKPGTSDSNVHIWADDTVLYCFEDKTWPEKDNRKTREILADDLDEALALWHNAGLPESFRWIEETPAVCEDRSKRGSFISIEYSLDGTLLTTVGITPALDIREGYGPRMILSDDLSKGMLNVVANYAHEMGHAWGLYHEQQNEAFWAAPYSESGGTLFTMDNFHCENLADYQSKYNLLKAQASPGEFDSILRNMCTKRNEAFLQKFSAYDYLPITDEPLLASKKGIDWDSIMLYPSGAGGSGTAANGVDNRAKVLTKPGGEPIGINLKPSPRDVEGLKKLYLYDPDSNWRALGDKASAVKNKFDIIRRKDPDSECG